MTKELLSQIANMELRDQLEAKEQMIKNLKEKLEIAIEVLEEYANEDHWEDCVAGFNPKSIDSGCYGVYGFSEAQEALDKIKGE